MLQALGRLYRPPPANEQTTYPSSNYQESGYHFARVALWALSRVRVRLIARSKHVSTLSAIITTTGRSTLHEALDSVRGQTSPADEIIVVHDTPEPPALQEAGVRSIWTQGASNACIARNRGVEAATSDFVAFLDDDDYWLESHVACARRAIKESGAAVLCASFWKRIGDNVQPEKTAPTSIDFNAFFCRNPGLRGSNLIIEAATYLRVGGFDPSFPSQNDLDLGIRLADHNVAYHGITERTVVFRQHEGPRLSTRGSTANRNGVLAFWRRYSERMNHAEKEAYAAWVAGFWGFVDFPELAEKG